MLNVLECLGGHAGGDGLLTRDPVGQEDPQRRLIGHDLLIRKRLQVRQEAGGKPKGNHAHPGAADGEYHREEPSGLALSGRTRRGAEPRRRRCGSSLHRLGRDDAVAHERLREFESLDRHCNHGNASQDAEAALGGVRLPLTGFLDDEFRDVKPEGRPPR